MISVGTRLRVADNTGAKNLAVIRILGGTRHRYAYLGDIVISSVKSASPRGVVKKKDIVRVVIARTRKEQKRADGSTVRFDDNAGVIVDKDGNPRGSRIFGPIPRELKDRGYNKIISQAAEVV
ncbi:50S ribosomal protein L14 [bacterium CG_4_10_14_0_2_um_filter_33_32]|nr:MAG: 50S ribosomal protein L14 [bacterium CG2_30_33_46]PIR67369.1 MAG: 50S ribosomal protein L14 [bacterium CG10_big_fil_rev_8_21_14_0_10_33_18]PIU76756.1 MAG: 50S ribosomal protein L14 [bacterium CG06_land_8_20_14_3_00_33_50]PIW81298.1 MAG: 50S ribosomal protein L14 [bacterium CG_4_8_14_3_um_filter_33_28]PIY85713.1 MAG: 50S ribosomal protein L14 [bacterium CG_4_10_14_0_8_um_filter_33_57]PIZ86584.1 MAG: 50S ribosomal protein L14 [bacterium CG_4_10_14_0_2_um_filter_33_32]PJA72113.1 MAG: 50S